MKKIRMGVIGVGGISAFHISGINKSLDAELVAICDINSEVLKRKGDMYEIPESHRFLKHEDLLSCSDVDAVSICTPNFTHFPIAVDAIKHRKPFALEKPVTMTHEQAKILKDMTAEANIPNMVCFSYRFKAAARYARWIIEQGYLGNIYHVYTQYLQAWGNNNGPLVWRFQKEKTGSGALGDLGSHALDLVKFILNKEYIKVCGHAGTFVTTRKKIDSEETGIVDVDDYCHYMAQMEDGISAVYEISRFGFGRGNYQRVEVYGSKGGLVYKLDENGNGIDSIELCIGDVFGQVHEYHESAVPNRFKADQMQSFFDTINGKGDGFAATITDGYINQTVVDAIIESFENEKWVYLKR